MLLLLLLLSSMMICSAAAAAGAFRTTTTKLVNKRQNVEKDMKECHVTLQDAQDRNKWKLSTHYADPK